jgi:hypothetical protein
MTLIHSPASADPVLREHAYNLFRNTQRPMLICAVPEHCPVPNFIDAQAWSFEHVLRSQDVPPPGFDDSAARAGVRYNGFYLFQTAGEKLVGSHPPSGYGQKHGTECVATSLHSRSQTGAAEDAQHIDSTFVTQSKFVVSK